jgi:hypothetical protein
MLQMDMDGNLKGMDKLALDNRNTCAQNATFTDAMQMCQSLVVVDVLTMGYHARQPVNCRTDNMRGG